MWHLISFPPPPVYTRGNRPPGDAFHVPIRESASITRDSEAIPSCLGVAGGSLEMRVLDGKYRTFVDW